MYKTSTRSHSASATNAAKYPTYTYLDFEYQYTALSIVLVALHQRVTKGKENNQRVPRMATCNLNSPISYSNSHSRHSKQSEMYQSPCITPMMASPT